MTSKLDLNRAFAEHGVTSKTVAERIGLTPQTVSAYVTGNPTVKSLYQIADALECDVRDLFYPRRTSCFRPPHLPPLWHRPLRLPLHLHQIIIS